MNIFLYTSNAMQRFANKKFIIPLFVLLVLILTMMEGGPFSSLKLEELSGGMGMLDMQFGYNRLQVNNMLDSIGTTGRQLYVKLLGLRFRLCHCLHAVAVADDHGSFTKKWNWADDFKYLICFRFLEVLWI